MAGADALYPSAIAQSSSPPLPPQSPPPPLGPGVHAGARSLLAAFAVLFVFDFYRETKGRGTVVFAAPHAADIPVLNTRRLFLSFFPLGNPGPGGPNL